MKQFPSKRITISRRQALLGLSAISATAVAQTGTTPPPTEMTASATPDQWNLVKAQLVLNPRLAYFDTASFGPATRAVLAAEYRATEALHTDAQEFYAARYNSQAVHGLCNRMASWLNCAPDELSFTRGAQAGLELFATAYAAQPALQSGDELVVCNQLSTTGMAFWTSWGRQRGLSIKTVMLPSPLLNETQAVESFNAALSERTRFMVFSHIQHTDGAILPVRDLCRLARAHKVISIVDGALALGAIPVSMQDLECDVYSSSLCHWLNAPQHTGVLFVRREHHAQLPFLPDNVIENLDLNMAAWPALLARLPQDFLQYAPQFQALPAALALQEGIGRTVITARIRELSSYTRLQLQNMADLQILTPVQGGLWVNVLALRTARRSSAELVNYLHRTDQVVISGLNQPSGSVLRISLHIFNSFDDIDRLVRGLSRALRS